MKTIKVRDLLKILFDDGWVVVAQRGSHRQLKHPTKPGKVTVNGGDNDDVYGFLLKSISRQSGIEF